jgi:hypothetical protein
MAERMSTVCVAYTKGVKAYRATKRKLSKWNRVECPYGATKRELASWWNAGYHDASKDNIDYNYFKSDAVNFALNEDEQ